MANNRKDGPHWVKAWIADLSMLTDSFRDMNTGAVNFETLGKEEYLFRMALSRKDFSLSNRAKKVWDEAVGPYNQRITAANKKSPQDAPNGNAGVDVSDAGNGAASKSPTSCDQFTADGDIREDSQDITTSGNGSVTESGTSANLYGPRQAKNGDAATREGAEVVNSRESGAAGPTTVSRNMRRVPQNEAPAHGFSGGRTAQGTMSCSPEAAAQSGKAYDQEAAKTRDTRDDSRGRYAPPSCSPEDGNPAETAPSHGGSVASLEARQGQARESRRAGGNSVRGVEKVNTPPARSAGPMPADKQAVYDFAAAEGLDTADAYECWRVTVNERGGLTADGNPIKNWKAYVRKWCRTRAKNRRSA
ncbi:hypothetical protein [Fibrobacter sp.]|uniref:hypothetical protein n=1 Tax=Fibrobacter sp. TaxID=35828 RepID=UPI00388F89E7